MGWQRYNRTANAFEVSDDNGVSWQTLPINGAVISGTIPNVAYRNQANTFTANQSVSAAGPRLIIQDSSQGVDLKNWDILNANGKFYIEYFNDAFSTGGAALTLDRSGNLGISGNFFLNGGIFDFGRNIQLGVGQTFVPIVRDNSGNAVTTSGVDFRYALIGKMLFFSIYGTITLPVAGASYVTVSLPYQPRGVEYTTAYTLLLSAFEQGIMFTRSTGISLYRAGLAAWPAGNATVYGAHTMVELA